MNVIELIQRIREDLATGSTVDMVFDHGFASAVITLNQESEGPGGIDNALFVTRDAAAGIALDKETRVAQVFRQSGGVLAVQIAGADDDGPHVQLRLRQRPADYLRFDQDAK